MNKKPNTFPIPSHWLTNTVRVHVIGCGGTGAQVLTRLGQMDHALREMGHAGFDVTVWDDDKVEPFNVGRQPFYMADVGHHKAKVLVNRVNIAYGCTWTAQTCRFKAKDAPRGHALIIGCVDTKASRREIHKGLTEQYSRNIWLHLSK
jgi:PRTRC genetic system ThiF family protein